jgi:hypothetical protein
LAELEDVIRVFEDFERPGYEAWLRLELGPQISAMEELLVRIRERRNFAARVTQLAEAQELHPREALYLVLEGGRTPQSGEWDPDEIEARRRSKREMKRQARGEAKKATRKATQQAVPKDPGRRSVVDLFRDLARKLHPDSAEFMSSLPPARIQTLWLKVVEAYQARSMEELLAIAVWIENTEGHSLRIKELTLRERFERVKTLRRAVSRMERKTVQLTEHPAWEFRKSHGSERRKLRSSAARQLDQEMARAQDVFESVEDFIDSIGSPRPPRKASGRGR